MKYLPNFIFYVWFSGFLGTWTYLIARAYTMDEVLTEVVLFGWLVSLFWPLILMVQAWLTWWF